MDSSDVSPLLVLPTSRVLCINVDRSLFSKPQVFCKTDDDVATATPGDQFLYEEDWGEKYGGVSNEPTQKGRFGLKLASAITPDLPPTYCFLEGTQSMHPQYPRQNNVFVLRRNTTCAIREILAQIPAGPLSRQQMCFCRIRACFPLL